MEAKLNRSEQYVDAKTGFTCRYVYSDTEFFGLHFHDYYEIFLIIDGKVTHLINGEEIKLSKGALVFMRPDDTHSYRTINGTKFYMLNMAFSSATADSLFEYLGKGFPLKEMMNSRMPPQLQLSEQDITYILSHMTSILAIDELDYDNRQTALRILIFRIFTRYFSDYRDELFPDMPLWLTKLCDEMRRNGNFTYGIERMLELTDKSREHLSRSIKKYMGVTPSEFVNDLRLSFIANMLKNSNHRIADIVFESGFGNLSWASELFKKKYGMTMQEYKNEQ